MTTDSTQNLSPEMDEFTYRREAERMGFVECRDTEDNALIVYREGDEVHYYNWRDAVMSELEGVS